MLSPSALRNRKRNAPRPAWKVARAYGQWLRGRPCACEGRNPDCEGPTQAAHVPHPPSSGMGTKAADAYQIPLSVGCHLHTQHQHGWSTFTRKFLKCDPTTLAEAYWQRWPGRAAWESKNV